MMIVLLLLLFSWAVFVAEAEDGREGIEDFPSLRASSEPHE